MKAVAEHFGFTTERVVAAAKHVMGHASGHSN
jgi:hypothetical protein